MTKIRFDSWLPSLSSVLGLREHVFVPRGPRYTEAEARAAVAVSRSYSEVLRRLGMRAAGGNHRTIRRYVEEVWHIPTSHFDARAVRVEALRRRGRTPLNEVLTEGSTYSRGHLKERLYSADLKQRRCELCGQGEHWRGRRMSLILDHANGIADDNRLENLRIVCPNCAATLPTHCGRNLALVAPRVCVSCGSEFMARSREQRYCSRTCGRTSASARPHLRKCERPSHSRLLAEVEELGFAATGRRYGVSDNAIRKWLRTSG
jgi:ribosomal protein S27AE